MTAVILSKQQRRTIVSDRERVRKLIARGWHVVAVVRLGEIIHLEALAIARAA